MVNQKWLTMLELKSIYAFTIPPFPQVRQIFVFLQEMTFARLTRITQIMETSLTKIDRSTYKYENLERGLSTFAEYTLS